MLSLKLVFGKLHCNRSHQSWIDLRLVGHRKDDQVHIAQCHKQVELKLPLQIILNLINTAAAVTDHAPHKDAIVHLPRWLVHCAAICCNTKTVSLLQETEYDLDIDSDTISDNSDTDVSDNDDC